VSFAKLLGDCLPNVAFGTDAVRRGKRTISFFRRWVIGKADCLKPLVLSCPHPEGFARLVDKLLSLPDAVADKSETGDVAMISLPTRGGVLASTLSLLSCASLVLVGFPSSTPVECDHSQI
jgi:hypothetical protein